MHQNQVHRLRGIQNTRDLERYFAIGVAEDGLTVLHYECQIQASAPSDIRQRNAHTQFSKSRSRRIHVTTSSTPWRVFRLVKTNGFAPRIILESRSITIRSAPTYGARSVLLITSRSERVIPGPPLRGTLSPPATSMTYIEASTSSGLKLAARLSPPLSKKRISSRGNRSFMRSTASKLIDASSRIAVCGHPPVSTPMIRSEVKASLRTRNSI